jgi:hypothetical protein
MSLDEYEALLAEKKAALNKKAATRTVDISEFANLKAVNKDEEEEENPLEVSAAGRGNLAGRQRRRLSAAMRMLQ